MQGRSTIGYVATSIGNMDLGFRGPKSSTLGLHYSQPIVPHRCRSLSEIRRKIELKTLASWRVASNLVVTQMLTFAKRRSRRRISGSMKAQLKTMPWCLASGFCRRGEVLLAAAMIDCVLLMLLGLFCILGPSVSPCDGFHGYSNH